MTFTRDNPPPIVQKRPEDLIPCSDGIWCSIGDGEPFVNEIVIVRLGERDGVLGWLLMLDTHNFDFVPAGETIGVVEAQQKGLS